MESLSFNFIAIAHKENVKIKLEKVINTLYENSEIPIIIIKDKKNPFFKEMVAKNQREGETVEYVLITIKYLKGFEV